VHLDVTEYRDFYAGALGGLARRFIRRRLREMWPDVQGLDVLGLGYATPYLRPFVEQAERVNALMPAGQGVVPWPAETRRLTALVEETHLPVPDALYDRIVLVHALENADSVRAMMREVWRVLAPEGKLLLVVPNRRSLWARSERTPFGHGRPYSKGQLERLLSECLFSADRCERALFLPPFEARAFVRSAAWWERVGEKMWPEFAGVLLVEATKHVMIRPDTGTKAPVLDPIVQWARGRRGARPAYGHRDGRHDRDAL